MFSRQSNFPEGSEYRGSVTNARGGVVPINNQKRTTDISNKLLINFNELPLPEPDDMPTSEILGPLPDAAMDLFDQFYNQIMLGFEVERLQSVVSKKDEEIEEWRNKYDLLDSRVTQELESMKNILESMRVSHLREKENWSLEMSQIKAQLLDAENRAGIEAEKFRKALEDNSKLTRELDTLRKQINSLEEELRAKAALENQIAELKRELQRINTALEKSKAEHKAQLEELKQSYELRIESLERQVADLQKEKERLKAGWEIKDRDYRSQITTLNEELERLEKDCREHQAARQAAELRIQDLQAKWNAERAELERKLKAAATQQIEYEARNASLMRDVERLTKSLSDKEREINEWRSAVRDRENEISRLKAEIEALRASLAEQSGRDSSRMQSLLAAKDREIESLREEIRIYTTRIDKSTIEMKAYITELERKIQYLTEEKEHLEVLNVEKLTEIESWRTKAMGIENSGREIEELRNKLAQSKSENERLTRSRQEYVDEVMVREYEVRIRYAQKLEIALVLMGIENDRLHLIVGELEGFRERYRLLKEQNTTTVIKETATNEMIIMGHQKELEKLRDRNRQLEISMSEKATLEISLGAAKKYISELENKVTEFVTDIERLNASLRERSTLHEADKQRLLIMERTFLELTGKTFEGLRQRTEIINGGTPQLAGSIIVGNGVLTDLQTKFQMLTRDNQKLIQEIENLRTPQFHSTTSFEPAKSPGEFTAISARDLSQMESAIQTLRAALNDYQTRFGLLSTEFERLRVNTSGSGTQFRTPITPPPVTSSPLGFRTAFHT